MCLKSLYGVLIVLGVLGLGVIAIGCGGGNSVVPSADAPVTQAEASDFAQEVNLRHADMPYLIEGKTQAIHMRVHLQSQLARCSGVASPAHHLVGLFPSPFFGGTVSSHRSVLVRSGVSVWAKPAFATAQHGAGSPLGRICLRLFLPRLARLAPGVQSTVYALPAPVANIGAVETRLRAFLPLKGVTVYIDVIGFLCGPAEVELAVTTEGVASKPWFEKELLSILYNRARTSDLIARMPGSMGGCHSTNYPFSNPVLDEHKAELERLHEALANEAK